MFEDRNIRTAKITRYYEKQHEIRPKSINFSRRDMYSDRPNFDENTFLNIKLNLRNKKKKTK